MQKPGTTAIAVGGLAVLLAAAGLIWLQTGRGPAPAAPATAATAVVPAAPATVTPTTADSPATPVLRRGQLRDIAKLTIIDDTHGLLYPRRVIEEQQLIAPLLTQLQQAQYLGETGGGAAGYILTLTGLGGTEFRLHFFPGGQSPNLLDMGMNNWWYVPGLDQVMAPLLPSDVQITLPADGSSPAQVLIKFADLVSAGRVAEADNLLAPNLRSMFQYNDYAPLRNTPRMEIVRLEEMTGESGWPPDVGGREQKVAVARVFAMDVRYKVLGLMPTCFKDGEIYHHKVTVTQYTPGGPWLISELSGKGC